MSDAEEVKKTSKKKSMKLSKTGIMAILLVVAIGAAGYFYQDAQNAKENSPEEIAARNEEESNKIVGELNTILLTESDSDPTVARVEEPDVLRDANPDFYKNVELGDHLVLYPQRAIIYRSAEKRIINVAPIIDTSQLNTGAPEGSSDTSEEATE